MQQRPELSQRAWGWREVKDGKPIRSFEVNLVTGAATASKVEDNGEMKRWSDTLDVEQGRTNGSALVAALHGDPAFRSDMDKARVEIAAIRQRSHTAPGDCARWRQRIKPGFRISFW